MKRIVCLALVVAFLIGAQISHAAQKVTVYGEESYIPYAFLDNGTPNGIYVKILNQVFSKMTDYDVTIELVPWKRALNLVETGKGFACFASYYRPKERPWVSPWSEPIISEGYAAYCGKEVVSKPRQNWPADFKGLELGCISGYSIPNKKELNFQDADNNETNLKKLISGRIDCFIQDDASIRYSMKQMNIPSGKIVKAMQVSSENGYLAFSKAFNASYKDDFVKKFNQVLSEMKKSGEVDKIVADFLGN
ncbi:transporter substrate-binding domain-containing protein [Maridesulfovibrio sp.]|uniref:substrate-binding periplasmic protein n=1 Tax=Maridesulfovibrio sp. TaxID=2795000 RepID=UPI002A18B6CC|nr:transporter substrate-binding domain-containing protein [Maridesulfovibrio sp.]